MAKPKRKIKRRRVRSDTSKKRRYDTKDDKFKFSKRTRFIIYEALRAKLPPSRAASLAGINIKTYNAWLRFGKNREEYPVHAEFRRRVKKIQTQHEKDALDIIAQAAKGGKKIIETKLVIGPKGKEMVKIKRYTPAAWQAAAWYLERRHKEEYAKDFSGKDAQQQQSAEDLAKEVKEAADRLFESVPTA